MSHVVATMILRTCKFILYQIIINMYVYAMKRILSLLIMTTELDIVNLLLMIKGDRFFDVTFFPDYEG
jgi:hypothetical protein